jgi:hypothetical protein
MIDQSGGEEDLLKQRLCDAIMACCEGILEPIAVCGAQRDGRAKV